MADMIFRAYKGRLAGDGTAIDLNTDDIKVMLLSSAYTPISTHVHREDLTANEVGASGTYAAGGSSLNTKSLALGTAGDADNYFFTSANPQWTGATISARYAALYKNVGTAATDPLIGVWDFGSTISSTNGTFTVQINASGWLKIGS